MQLMSGFILCCQLTQTKCATVSRYSVLKSQIYATSKSHTSWLQHNLYNIGQHLHWLFLDSNTSPALIHTGSYMYPTPILFKKST